MIQYPNAPNNEPRERESQSGSESLSESENHSDIRSSGSEESAGTIRDQAAIQIPNHSPPVSPTPRSA